MSWYEPRLPPCGKVRFPDEFSANWALYNARFKHRRGNENRRECRVYHCPVCQGWHLTSRPLRESP